MFLVEYEKKYREVKHCKLDLPNGGQGFFLLQPANLTPNLEKLVRTTAILVYGGMKEKIKKVLNDSWGKDSGSVPVKEEECYYTNRKSYYKKGGSNKKENNFGKSMSKLGTNLMDSDGNIIRCHEYDSTKHFASNCPHQKVEEINMTVHINLVTWKADSGTGSMLLEWLGKGILDSACTKTVSDDKWMNEYIENLNEEGKNEVLCCETESKSLFRFCDSVESKSTKTVNIPIVISSNRILLEVDIVKSNILLLISKDIMSKLGMKIDFTKHEAELNGQVIKLQCNSSGHYCIPLTTLARENCNVVFYLQ